MRVMIAVIAIVAGLGAFGLMTRGPSMADCSAIMTVPVSANQIVVQHQTPDGGEGLACLMQVDEIPLSVEAVRAGILSWRRGRIWVNGKMLDSRTTVARALEEAKGQVAAEKAAARLKGFVQGIQSAVDFALDAPKKP